MAVKTKRPISEHAAAAKAIRKELKAAFPTVTFSVTSESFSMGNAVRISWTDGPTTKQVEAITGKYQYGSFDGMRDIYENTNNRKDIPQAKYVQTSRQRGRDAFAGIVSLINSRYGFAMEVDEDAYYPWIKPESDGYSYGDRHSSMLHRAFHAMSLICDNGHAILPGDTYCPECGAKLAEYDPNAY